MKLKKALTLLLAVVLFMTSGCSIVPKPEATAPAISVQDPISPAPTIMPTPEPNPTPSPEPTPEPTSAPTPEPAPEPEPAPDYELLRLDVRSTLAELNKTHAGKPAQKLITDMGYRGLSEVPGELRASGFRRPCCGDRGGAHHGDGRYLKRGYPGCL